MSESPPPRGSGAQPPGGGSPWLRSQPDTVADLVSFAESDYSTVKVVTLTDVAQLAKVSPATVSRYLKGQRVRRAEAVRLAIEQLGYRPSEIARSLQSGITRFVGVVVPDVSNPFFAAVVKGIEVVSQQASLNVLLSNTDEDIEREREVIHGLVGLVRGVILVPAREDSDNTEELRRARVPVVLLDRQVHSDSGFDCVMVDNRGGAGQAVRYLAQLGHERIALISGPLKTTPGRERYEGFVDALEDAGLELDPSLVQVGDFKQESGRQATLRLLGLPTPPTAIVASNNLMSMGGLQALRDLRVRVPEDVSFVGFDDLELAELLTPPLSVIARPMAQQGILAMRLLRNRMEGDSSTPPKNIVLETHLMERGSCGSPTGT
jgi:LacI family transcriptional regulator